MLGREDRRSESLGEEVGTPSSQLENGIGADNAKKSGNNLRVQGGIGESKVACSVQLLNRVVDVWGCHGGKGDSGG